MAVTRGAISDLLRPGLSDVYGVHQMAEREYPMRGGGKRPALSGHEAREVEEEEKEQDGGSGYTLKRGGRKRKAGGKAEGECAPARMDRRSRGGKAKRQDGGTAPKRKDAPGQEARSIEPTRSEPESVSEPQEGRSASSGSMITRARGGKAKKWIQGMHMEKGALHRELGVPEGEKIPAAKIEKASHSENPTLAKRARLAQTLKGLHH